MSTSTAYYQLTDQVVALHGPVCHLCRNGIDLTLRNGPGSLQIDHLWPQSRGGCHHLANLRPSHRRCNGRRGNAILPTVRRPICQCRTAYGVARPVLPKSKPHGWRRFWGHALLWTLGLNPLCIYASVVFPPIMLMTVPLFFAVLALCMVIWNVNHPWRQGTMLEH